MLFNSYQFIFLFLPIVVIVFFALARYCNTRIATAFLVVASLSFYSYWDIRYLSLLILSILFNYIIGSRLEEKQVKSLLILGIGVDLTLLGYFKYTNFFISSLNDLLGTGIVFPEVILPLGISFFTFTQIAFLVDAYRGETENYSLLTYSLFVTFFPHLIAGPILYHRNIIPQFSQLKNFVVSYKNLTLGFTMFSMGLFKKVIIADTLAPWVSPVFANVSQVTFIEAWAGAIAYTLQLYFDFSGYSEMAIGLGLMLNIHLPVNFNSPYKARSIIDFWRRWHITLSEFLKQYLYISLGGNRYGHLAKMRNLMLTMLLGGLWHGAGWTFVVWGGLHGLFLIINHSWRKLGWSLPSALSWFITMICVVVAWVFFRAHSVADAIVMIQVMFGKNGITLPATKYVMLLGEWGVKFNRLDFIVGKQTEVIVLPLLMLGTLILPNPQQILLRFRPNNIWVIVITFIFVVCLLNLNKVSEFLYFQF